MPSTKTSIENCQLNSLCEFLANKAQQNTYFVVDSKLKSLYPELFSKLSDRNCWLLESPEKNKNLSDYERCCAHFIKSGLTRSSTIVAIGGGATSDFAGFVAATVLRGVGWEIVPSSLLSMIDASIGGKVGLNTDYGKNMLGSFHAPEKVYLCAELLDTLPEEEFFSGLGELVKYLYLSEKCYQSFKKDGLGQKLYLTCMHYKQEIVEKDYKESGKRKFLNLGHTLGHAYEKCLGIPHGLAVLKGLKTIGQGLFSEVLSRKWDEIIAKLGLSESLEKIDNMSVDTKEFWNYVGLDKKKSVRGIDLIIVTEDGPEILCLTLEELKAKVSL